MELIRDIDWPDSHYKQISEWSSEVELVPELTIDNLIFISNNINELIEKINQLEEKLNNER